MTSIIEDFISQYLREYDYYQEVAKLCQQHCEIDLEQNGIRAIVTHRAKRPDRLKKKLEGRIQRKGYKALSDIYDDIVDLAGVRVALYFPGDFENVEKLISARFLVKEKREFPETGSEKDEKSPYKKRFRGYRAYHFRVHLKENQLPEAQKRYAQARIEIQVASVLMHGWSEVEHDLIYKPLSGIPSHDEYAILDELNGIVLASEIALERLQRAMSMRSKGKSFGNHYELASYLHEAIRGRPDHDGSEPVMGRVDILFRFLQRLNNSSDELINNFIADLDPDRAITEQLVDRVVSGDKEKYALYSQVRSEVGSKNPYNFSEEEELPNTDAHALGYFLSRWIAFEASIRDITQEKVVSSRIFSSPSKLIQSIDIITDDEKLELLQIQRLRNQVVHGVEFPPKEYLFNAGRFVNEILKKLRAYVSEDIQRIIDSILANNNGFDNTITP